MKKSTGTLYFSGTGSDPLAETDLAGNIQREFVFFNGKRIARLDGPGASPTLHYYFSDHLGSASVVTDALGSMTACPPSGVISGEEESDYYPYGGERVICDRLPNQNYKFTGKERDSETGLDYFGARYYGSNMGRWLSPDWAANATAVPYADFGNPQSLNLYSYVGNNPLATADADGHCWPPSACADVVDSWVQTFRQDGLSANNMTSSSSLVFLNTFANGVTADLASGAADVLRLGNGTAAAIDSAKQGDYAGAAIGLSQDGGRAASVILAVTAVGGRANAPSGDTMQPGPHAGDSVPASGPRVTAAEQRAVKAAGQETGCHTCGTSNPGTKSGNFVGDHQPPTSLANGKPQSLYPQCLGCSRVQGGQVRAAQQAGRQYPPQQPPPPVIKNKKPGEN